MCTTRYQRTRIGPLLLLILALAGCRGSASAGRVAPTLTPPTTEATVSPAASAPACHADQLAGQFQAGGYATGNMTGVLLLRNVSPAACTVQGPVGFTGLDAQGQRIAATRMSQSQTLAPTVLPPNTPVVPPLVEPRASAYLMLLLIGVYRDDPSAADGRCSAASEVTPSRFVIAIGAVSVQAANVDPAGLDFKALYGCHGIILAGGASLSS